MSYFQQPAKIIEKTFVGPDTFLLDLLCPDIAASARPGQFVMARVDEGLSPLLRRPFSIHNTIDKSLVRLLVKIVGQGTRILSGLPTGHSLSLLGPLGHGFEIPQNLKNACLVAGGIGVAPLFFLGKALAAKGVSCKVLVGGQRAADLLCIREFEELGFEVLLATQDGSAGDKGMVTDLLADILEANSCQQVYACGPQAMLKVVGVMARNAKAPCQVSLETVMACGMGVCLGCAVKSVSGKILHACKDGPVVDADLLWD
ncbi:MAG: dihydroorotate dehydrogenase electron transfer subunit [Desulfatibacillaceae bacterium]|nr:dihydroorotate dehydrogenase electron transfer subunit [Desulfatibacillaceae bacterium]